MGRSGGNQLWAPEDMVWVVLGVCVALWCVAK